MLIDLLAVFSLGLFLWWPHRREPAFVSGRLSSARVGVAAFWRGFSASRFGVVVLLLAALSLVEWVPNLASYGLASLQPEFYTGGQREQTQCFKHQVRIRELGTASFAPKELVCPSTGQP